MKLEPETRRTKSKSGAEFPKVEIVSRSGLRAWLKKNHTQNTSVWGVTWKKRPGAPYVPYADIVEELICFGWIDSLPRALDEDRSMLLLSPRKPRSNWSKLNKNRAERMIALGKMAPLGLAKVLEAKANGAWSFLDDVDALTVPPDLAASLAAIPEARGFWDKFPPSTRRGILEWIENAKSTETRIRRIVETATQAGRNIRANQYRQILPGQMTTDPVPKRPGPGKSKA